MRFDANEKFIGFAHVCHRHNTHDTTKHQIKPLEFIIQRLRDQFLLDSDRRAQQNHYWIRFLHAIVNDGKTQSALKERLTSSGFAFSLFLFVWLISVSEKSRECTCTLHIQTKSTSFSDAKRNTNLRPRFGQQFIQLSKAVSTRKNNAEMHTLRLHCTHTHALMRAKRRRVPFLFHLLHCDESSLRIAMQTDFFFCVRLFLYGTLFGSGCVWKFSQSTHFSRFKEKKWNTLKKSKQRLSRKEKEQRTPIIEKHFAIEHRALFTTGIPVNYVYIYDGRLKLPEASKTQKRSTVLSMGLSFMHLRGMANLDGVFWWVFTIFILRKQFAHAHLSSFACSVCECLFVWAEFSFWFSFALCISQITVSPEFNVKQAYLLMAKCKRHTLVHIGIELHMHIVHHINGSLINWSNTWFVFWCWLNNDMRNCVHCLWWGASVCACLHSHS